MPLYDSRLLPKLPGANRNVCNSLVKVRSDEALTPLNDSRVEILPVVPPTTVSRRDSFTKFKSPVADWVANDNRGEPVHAAETVCTSLPLLPAIGRKCACKLFTVKPVRLSAVPVDGMPPYDRFTPVAGPRTVITCCSFVNVSAAEVLLLPLNRNVTFPVDTGCSTCTSLAKFSCVSPSK